MTSHCGKYSPHHRLGGHNKDRKGTEDNDFALQGLNFSAFSCQYNGGLCDPLVQMCVALWYVSQESPPKMYIEGSVKNREWL